MGVRPGWTRTNIESHRNGESPITNWGTRPHVGHRRISMPSWLGFIRQANERAANERAANERAGGDTPKGKPIGSLRAAIRMKQQLYPIPVRIIARTQAFDFCRCSLLVLPQCIYFRIYITLQHVPNIADKGLRMLTHYN